MPIARGKKRFAKYENLQSEGLMYDAANRPISPEIGLSRKKASKLVYEELNEGSVSPPIETGVNEIVKSCYKEIHNNIQAKKRRLEQFVSSAVTSTETKIAHCFAQANKEQDALRALVPTRPKEDAVSKLVNESRNNLDAIHQLVMNNHDAGFERALLSQVDGFKNSVEAFVELIDRKDTEQREQISHMQQELKRELAGMEKNLIKNEMQVIQNTNF